MPRTALAALVLAVTALTASGCGKSSSTTTASRQTSAAQSTSASTAPTEPVRQLSDSIFLDKVNTMCKRIYDRRESNRAENQQEVVREIEELGAFERGVVEEMASLAPTSPALGAAWKQIVIDAQALVNYTDQIAQHAKSGGLGTTGAVKLIARRKALEARAKLIAAHAVIKSCAASV